MIVSLDLHDWSVVNNHMDLLWELKNKYPQFKVSLFAVPDDFKHRKGTKAEALHWMQIIPHGIRHNSSECKKMTYDQFRSNVIPAIDKAFTQDGITYVKGFAAPHWHWNTEVVRALDDEGWWGAINPRKKSILPKRYYAYSHRIDEPFPTSGVVKLHGHLNGTDRDDLKVCMDNVMRIPQNAEWHFIADFIENHD